MTEIHVSVVVTAHNEERTIGKTVGALVNQIGFQSGAFEIVFVDDGSTDATVERACEAGGDLLTVLHNDRSVQSRLTTRQRALDLGFRSARGEVICTIDADGIPASDWVVNMVRTIRTGEADAVAGPIGFRSPPAWISGWQSCDAAYYFLVSFVLGRLGYIGGVFFGNFAFRAELYSELGGFEELGFALTEDLQFGRALQINGHRLVYRGANCLVEFDPCTSFGALIQRTARVSSGPFSVLAGVLTLIPLTLLALLIGGLVTGEGLLWSLFGLRYIAGVAIILTALNRFGKLSHWPSALYYEPLVLLIAPAVMFRVKNGVGIHWGNRSYER